MRDRDIREVLWRRLESEHEGDRDTLMLDELSLLHGSTRIDVAVINGEIQGYELKSEKDTLERLQNQATIYNSVLDRVTLVMSDRHSEKALGMIPDWWGVCVAHQTGSTVALKDVRAARQNPALDALSIARMVWRDEALTQLEKLGAARGIRGKPREAVYIRLAETMDLTDLRDFVRATIKARSNWRADRRQTQCDG